MSPDLIHFFTVNWLGQLIVMVAQCLAVTVPLLVSVAYMTYVDRKVWASIQLRRGPNVVGPFGLLQPFADGLKLVLKETIVPSSANAILFIIAPMITFMTALVACLDEWHQTYLPSRTGSLRDVLLDSTAALVAQLVIFLFLKARQVTAPQTG